MRRSHLFGNIHPFFNVLHLGALQFAVGWLSRARTATLYRLMAFL